MIRIITLVFTFLIRLRFPKTKGFVQVVKQRYGPSALQQYRLLEKLDFKLKKANLDLEFLTTCKRHETIPKFLHFKVHNYNVPSTTFYRSFLFKLLDFEIKHKIKLIKRTETRLETARSDLKNNISHLDYMRRLTRKGDNPQIWIFLVTGGNMLLKGVKVLWKHQKDEIRPS